MRSVPVACRPPSRGSRRPVPFGDRLRGCRCHTISDVIILGIESSCDETAAAVVASVRGRPNPRLLSSIVASQMAVHRPYGGVVPELASRSHIRFITEVVQEALTKARVPLRRIDAVAATAG